jgi:hypothetical protein
MKAYINHFFLNAGSAIACIWYAIVPPQWTGHKEEDIKSLSKTDPINAFLKGILG